MSLDFNLSKIRDREELLDEGGQLHPRWAAIVFACMSVGIGEITSKNIDEFWKRLDIIQAVDGPHLCGHEDPEQNWLTRADVERMVGLTTNVFPKESEAAFMKKMGRVALEKAIRLHKHRDKPALSAGTVARVH
jgi:hypothetical protein